MHSNTVFTSHLISFLVPGPVTSITPTVTASSLLISTLARQGSDDKRATHSLLDLSDGSHLQTIKGGINVQYRCRSTLSADDSTIIAGDEQGKIQVWDVLSGKQRPFSSPPSDAHSKAVLWVEATTKEGGRIVSAAADGTVKIWERRMMD